MRYSPWSGIAYFGRRMSISSPSSSREAWPETWTSGSIAFQITSAPRRNRLSIVRATLSSLPGTGLEASTTVSPSRILTSRWSPTAMRDSAACGSPLEAGARRIPSRAGRVQVAELDPDLDRGHEAAPGHGDLAPAPLGDLEDLADAGEVGGEGRNDHAAGRPV